MASSIHTLTMSLSINKVLEKLERLVKPQLMLLKLSFNPKLTGQQLLTLQIHSALQSPELLTQKFLHSHSKRVVSSFGLSLVLLFASSLPALAALGDISTKKVMKINSTKLKTTMLESENEKWKHHSKKV